MKRKNETVIFAGKGATSEKLQHILFLYGYKWPVTGMEIRIFDREIVICITSNNTGWWEFDYYSEDTVIDFDASTEMPQIVEWLSENNKKRELKSMQQENERLKREIAQLRDELDEVNKIKPSEFPEGYDWHNPDGLSAEQVGVSEGWRLALKSDMWKRLPQGDEMWMDGRWVKSWNGFAVTSNQTFRTKQPLPSLVNAPVRHPESATPSTDGFPSLEKERYEVIRKWMKDQLTAIEAAIVQQ